MALIRSAVEIALEKTQEIKGDKNAILARESREEGMRLASSFMEDADIDLSAHFKQLDSDRAAWVKEAFLQTILSNLTLPKEERDLERIEPLFKAFEQLARDKGTVKKLKQQISEFLKQFIDDRRHLSEALTKQYAPVLRQKEDQLRRQYGRAVRLDPMNDPDFVKAFNQNLGNLEKRYGQVVDQVKEELRRLSGA